MKTVQQVYNELRIYWWAGRPKLHEPTGLRLALSGQMVNAVITWMKEAGK
jgi:hypothetical protein